MYKAHEYDLKSFPLFSLYFKMTSTISCTSLFKILETKLFQILDSLKF